MKNKKFLNEADLIEYWENFTGLSDDGCDDSDTDSNEDPSFLPENENNIDHDERDIPLKVEENDNQDHSDVEDNIPLAALVTAKRGKGPKTKNIEWKSRCLELNEDQLRFRGDDQLPDEILSLENPYQFFNYFFSNELIAMIVQETNLYAVQTKPERPPFFSENDIKQYLSIIIFTSLVHMPNIRSFWSKELRFAPVADMMPINRFEKIRRFVHFTNNETFISRDQPGHDRLHKIRLLVEFLNNKFSSISLEQHLSIDKQMCSTKVRHYMKQYMPMKPHKWGFKFFVMSGVSGFAYKLEIYTGQEKLDVPDNEPDLGVTSNVVLRLAKIIPRQQNYKLYHDNYYTSLPLMVHLAKQGIYSLGTI